MSKVYRMTFKAATLSSALLSSACSPLMVGHNGSEIPQGRWLTQAEASHPASQVAAHGETVHIAVTFPRTQGALAERVYSHTHPATPVRPHHYSMPESQVAPRAQTIPYVQTVPAGPQTVIPTYPKAVPHVQAAPFRPADSLEAAPNWALHTPPLSPGDRVRIHVSDGEEFSGLFELDLDGTLNLPYLPPLQLAGQQRPWAERKIAGALVNAGFFRPGLVHVSLQVQQWAPVQVNVSGAVFNPGMVTVNARKPEERAQKSVQLTGDFPPERMLPAALRSAGGVRPDADVKRVMLIRNGQTMEIDLSGYLSGSPAPTTPLMAGDRLIVPSSGRYDEALIKPSAITPPGIRVFLSNLTIPATGNSVSAINEKATSLPYGTRMLTALISANCVGGTAATNSARYGVLVTRNPLSDKTEVIERPIEQLLREPHRDELNPMVMPHDGVACYDSGVTNLRDIARTVADLLMPFRL